MSVTNGPRLGTMISAVTGDQFPVDFRKFLRQYHALVQAAVISKTLTAPPGSPANGDAYIVGASATGAWATHDKAIAIWTTDNPATPAGLWEFYGPTIGFSAFNAADSKLYVYDGSTWNAVGAGGGGTAFQNQQMRNIIYGYKNGDPFGLGNYTGPRGSGDTVQATAGTLGGASGTSAHGAGTTLVTSGTGAGASIAGDAIYRTGRSIKLLGKLWLSRTTDTRFVFGLASGVNDSDSPFDFTAFFRYSTIASDTNFQCVTGDGTSVTVTDSGIPADTNEHTFAIIFDDVTPNVQFYIDGTLVATNTTNLPPSGHYLCYEFLVRGNSSNNTAGFGQMVIDVDF